jgi:hypothetical protein
MVVCHDGSMWQKQTTITKKTAHSPHVQEAKKSEERAQFPLTLLRSLSQ